MCLMTYSNESSDVTGQVGYKYYFISDGVAYSPVQMDTLNSLVHTAHGTKRVKENTLSVLAVMAGNQTDLCRTGRTINMISRGYIHGFTSIDSARYYDPVWFDWAENNTGNVMLVKGYFNGKGYISSDNGEICGEQFIIEEAVYGLDY